MSKHLIIFLLLLGTLSSKAQSYPPTFRAVVEQGGDGPFFLTQSAGDSLGNTFWAGGYLGSTASVGTLILTNTHPWSPKACLFKLGPQMDERWAKSSYGPGEHLISGLAVDAQRDCYFSLTAYGGSVSFDNATYTSPSNQFTVVFKYDSAGNRIWAHQMDGVTADGWNKSLTITTNNLVFFGGAFEDKRSVVRKLNANGSTAWKRTGDQIQIGLSFSLRADLAGNCFMLSSFTNATVTFGDTVLQNRGVQNYVLVKYDSVGDISWVRSGGGNGPSEDYGIDLAVDLAGDVYVLSVIGSTNFLFGTNDIPLTPRNWVLSKYSANSQPLWTKSFSDPYLSEIGGISLDADNGILISASSRGGEDYSSAFLAKCSTDGDLVWTKRVRTSPGAVRWGSRLIALDSNLYVAGASDYMGDSTL